MSAGLFTLAEVAEARREAFAKGHAQGISAERDRAVRCYDACFARRRVTAEELPEVLQRLALLLARGGEP